MHAFMRAFFNFFGEVTKIVIVALLIVLPVRYFLVQPFFVRGESMEPNFLDQEYLLIDEISYRFSDPARGDVVVFHYPRNPSDYYIKRVIGLPGERLVGRDDKITVYSDAYPDGLVLDESAYLPASEGLGAFEVQVLGEGEYFMVGDNRSRSYDSRRWGPMDKKYIVGKVWLVVWPFPRAQAVTAPPYYFFLFTPVPEPTAAPPQKGYYLAPSGMHDILPEQQGAWLKFRAICEKEATQFGYGRIETPVLEFLKVFEKGTGAGTDVVEKELYSLSTKGGEALALRPEFTPGIIRAYLEHGLASQPRPVRLFALGPLFRHDRPQKGRFRQFHQLDFECINSDSAACDVEIIFVTFRILKKLGLKNFSFHVSSIGDPACRPAYERQLKGHLRAHKSKLCGDCKRRLEKNPLRVFDCKEEKCQRVARVAPKIIDNLCEACHRHFKETLEMLDELEVPYQLNGNIVRGLDYYTRTVFEVLVTSDQAGETKSLALGGGGRYDGLAEVLGGRPTPAGGGGLGGGG